MAYLFLVLSSVSNVSKGVASKKLSFAMRDVNDISFFYVFRMLFTAIIGAILVLIFDGGKGFVIESRTLLLAAVVGLAFALHCMAWIFAQHKGAYAICDALIVASSILPIILAYFIYNEVITVADILGYVAIVGGCVLVVLYNKQIDKKITISLILIYLLYMITFGLFDFGKKIFNYDIEAGVTQLSANGFTFYTFIFATVAFIIFYLFTFKKESFEYQRSIFWRELPRVAFVAVLTYVYAYLLVLAAGIDATIQYPLKNALGLILNVIVAAIILKEKPTARLFIGLSIIIASLVVISIF